MMQKRLRLSAKRNDELILLFLIYIYNIDGQMKNLFFVIEDQNGIQYNCDKNLNRISVVDHDNYFYHEYDNCYLITSEEKEVVKKNLGDKAVEQGNFEEADSVIGKYNIFSIFKTYFCNPTFIAKFMKRKI